MARQNGKSHERDVDCKATPETAALARRLSDDDWHRARSCAACFMVTAETIAGVLTVDECRALHAYVRELRDGMSRAAVRAAKRCGPDTRGADHMPSRKIAAAYPSVFHTLGLTPLGRAVLRNGESPKRGGT